MIASQFIEQVQHQDMGSTVAPAAPGLIERLIHRHPGLEQSPLTHLLRISDGVCWGGLWEIWSAQRILEQSTPNQPVAFCDVMICSEVYYWHHDMILVHTETGYWSVCDDFEEFLDLAYAHSEDVHLPLLQRWDTPTPTR